MTLLWNNITRCSFRDAQVLPLVLFSYPSFPMLSSHPRRSSVASFLTRISSMEGAIVRAALEISDVASIVIRLIAYIREESEIRSTS